VRASNHTFEELDKDIGLDAAFFVVHEAHVTARREPPRSGSCRSGLRLLDDRSFASSAQVLLA
jgi:hypothetical protein